MLEIKMLKNSKNGLIIIFSSILAFVLGLLLLVSLDGYKLEEISVSMLQYSVYTVYTQFGFFIFPIIPMYIICNEYSDKNIIFYQEIGYTPLKFVINKIISIALFVTIGNILVSLMIALMYTNFNTILMFFVKIQNISIYIIMVSIMISYLTGNFIKSFCINFGFWILGIILSTLNKSLSIFAFYDATLVRHNVFERILENNKLFDISLIYEIIYNILVFIIISLIVIIFKKRWVKNGI